MSDYDEEMMTRGEVDKLLSNTLQELTIEVRQYTVYGEGVEMSVALSLHGKEISCDYCSLPNPREY